MAVKFVFTGNGIKGSSFKEVGESIVARFNKLTTEIIRLNKISDLIGMFLGKLTTEQIRSEGKRGNTPYQRLVRRRTTGRGILDNTGMLLEDVMKYKIRVKNSENSQDISLMLDNKYAFFLQAGTKKMVARPILVLTDRDKAKLREIVVSSLTKANKKKLG